MMNARIRIAIGYGPEYGANALWGERTLVDRQGTDQRLNIGIICGVLAPQLRDGRDSRDEVVQIHRVELLPDPDTGEQQFSSSRYSQVYCLDPTGNIVEPIARHDLSNDAKRPFGSVNFCQVSEIGLPVPDVRHAVEVIKENVGISPRDSRVSEISDDAPFAAVGNDHGVFIIVNEGRGWFPTRNQTEKVYPRTVRVSEAASEYTFPNLPYHILPS